MDEPVQHALAQGGVIDITTRGRNTGQPRRIEIRFHNIEGQVYMTGRPPRRRDWYANLLTHPDFTSPSKRAYTRTCPPERHPFWIRPDDARSSRPFIRNAASITMSRRGLSIAPWWPWNSWSRELADYHADLSIAKLYDRGDTIR